MKLYRYWATAETTAKDGRGKSVRLKKWGGSNASLEDAQAKAGQALHALAIRAGKIDVNSVRGYAYDVRDIPEEIIGEADENSGITRNRLGCLVLNAAQAMFVDVDLPYYGLFSKLLRKPKPEEVYLSRLDDWVKRHPQVGVRVYRTAAGFRYIVTHAPLQPNKTALAWLTELGSDPLYVKLCGAQNCFRARLTPKPWRIDIPRTPNDYPRAEPHALAAFDQWLAAYNRKSENFAVCRFLKNVGSDYICDELTVLVRDHDRATKARSDLPLA